jgi:exodeoxyribonuclease VII small subunit
MEEQISFEDALKKLEETVNELEEGKLTLDESLKKFEEGVELSWLCTQKLQDANKKIEILKQSEGKINLEQKDIED